MKVRLKEAWPGAVLLAIGAAMILLLVMANITADRPGTPAEQKLMHEKSIACFDAGGKPYEVRGFWLWEPTFYGVRCEYPDTFEELK